MTDKDGTIDLSETATKNPFPDPRRKKQAVQKRAGVLSRLWKKLRGVKKQ